MRKLISSPEDIGISEDILRNSPGAILEIRDDVLSDLMSSPHPVLVRAGHTGARSHGSGVHRAPRRTCI